MERGDIYLVSLDPTLEHEQRGTRPVLVVSASGEARSDSGVRMGGGERSASRGPLRWASRLRAAWRATFRARTPRPP
ncbi:MAG: type II toxin-antitoxin system PemK/MazF family toxin [Alphaproteobacteria bacterium]|nr:type II toxin-antitoxin system PemK/MazF family toxin [Alphaproteobacteria bacterium]